MSPYRPNRDFHSRPVRGPDASATQRKPEDDRSGDTIVARIAERGATVSLPAPSCATNRTENRRENLRAGVQTPRISNAILREPLAPG